LDLLLKVGAKPLFDDRTGKILKEKFDLADFYGIPVKIVIGEREARAFTVTIKWRNGKTEEVPFIQNALLDVLKLS